MRRIVLKTLAAGLAGAFLALPAQAQQPVEVEFYYPVAVGGPITKIVDDMVADFHKENPDIRIKPIYAGTYQDSIAKALTALKGGTPPQLAVLLSTDMFTLIDEDAIVPVDGLAKSDADKKWLGGFYDAFMQNSRTGGHVWGVPFQRSTIVMYYNKDLFKEAGLDPERAPATWDELVEYGKKLTKKDANGNVSQWGVKIPSGGAFAYWLFQALTTPNDAILMNEEGSQVYLDKPAVVEAAQFWQDLSVKHGVMPKGTIDWGTTPKDFLEKKAAIVWTTTGNLTNIRKNADFPFGVAMMPKKKRGGSPTGGGNFYIFKSAEVRPMGHHARARRRLEHRHRLRGGDARRLADRAHEEVRPGSAGSHGGARPTGGQRGRVLHPREPARDQGAQRCAAGRADRLQDAAAGPDGRAARSRSRAALVQVMRSA